MQRADGENVAGFGDSVRSDLLAWTCTLVDTYGTVGRPLSNGYNVVSSGYTELSFNLRVLVNAERTAEPYTARTSRRFFLLSKERRMAAHW